MEAHVGDTKVPTVTDLAHDDQLETGLYRGVTIPSVRSTRSTTEGLVVDTVNTDGVVVDTVNTDGLVGHGRVMSLIRKPRELITCVNKPRLLGN